MNNNNEGGGKSRKKKRTANYTPIEVKALLELCNRSTVLENKRTDAATNKEKELEWQEIETKFNATSVEPFRSWKQLRRKYEQVKKELRKRIAVSYRATQYKNEPGDGPFQKRDALKPLTPEEEDLFENLKSNAVGNPNLYGVETDHTTVFTAPFHSEVIGSYKNLSQYIREGEEEFEEDEPTVEVGEDEECVFVTDVRPTTSTRAKNKTEKRGLFKNLALKNKKLVQAELDLISLKRKHQEEIHQLEVKKLKLEIEILEKNL